MIRRILLIAAVAFAGVLIGKATQKRTADKKMDLLAEATWASEGGAPAPEPDTPAAI